MLIATDGGSTSRVPSADRAAEGAGSVNLDSLTRWLRMLSIVASGDPRRIARRGKNVVLVRALAWR